jgi:hypothetical protein
MKEIKILHDKCSIMENEIKILHESKSDRRKINLNKSKRTIKKKEITIGEKNELATNINTLTIAEKREMRSIIKDYITIYNEGQFEFNINCLPRDAYEGLKKYVENCMNKNKKENVKIETREKVKELIIV